MGKGKNKKNAKQNNTSKSLQPVNINLPENMNKEEMQHIIARAIVEAEEIEAQHKEEQHQKDLAEWHGVIGYKEHRNKFKNGLNKVIVLFRVMFLPEKHIKGDIALSTLLKLCISTFFGFMNFLSLLLSACLIAYMPIQHFTGKTNQFPWLLYVYLLPCAIIAFILSRLFRMASIEIDKLDNRNYLFGFFASITSFVSIIIAIIAIAKGA